MTRRALSPRKRLALFTAHFGICHLCKGKISTGEAWEVEHVIPLAMGGADDETNMAPAHVKCHRAKTDDDVTNIARAKRRELRHVGIKKSGRPMPGSKASGWRKRMDGTVVRRDSGKRSQP